MRLARLLVLLALTRLGLAACGGDDESPASGDTTAATTTETSDGERRRRLLAGRLRGRRGARARSPTAASPPPEDDLDDGHDLPPRGRDELRHLHDHARPGARAEDDRLARLARGEGLLRRHDLPPRRARASSSRAATRPEPARGGPGYQTVDVPPERRRLHAGRRRDGEGRRSRRRARPGASSSSSPGQDVGLPPEYAIVGEVTEGLDTVLAIDELGVADGPPSQPVVIERVTVVGELMPWRSRRWCSPPAPRPASGARSRPSCSGTSSPPLRDGGSERRSSSSPAPTSSRPTRASSSARTGSSARARRCAAASRRCRRTSRRRSSSSPTAPISRATPSARVVAAWREHGAPFVAASYGGVRGHPVLVARSEWATVPDEGLRDARAAPRAVRRPRPARATSTGPADLPERFRTTPDEPM